MQIVIDIPEEIYKQMISRDIYKSIHESLCYKAIQDGAPLPKGHGRLIDGNIAKEKMGNLDGFGFIGKCIDEIPTILEADKEI